MDATCAIQASIHVFSLVRKYVSRILGTYHLTGGIFHVKVKAVIRLTEVEMTTGSIA